MDFLYIPKFDLTLYIGSTVLVTWKFNAKRTKHQIYIADFTPCIASCGDDWCSLKVKVWCDEVTDYKCLNNNISKIEIISRGINKVTEI